jgi:hypothetical protein
MKRLLVLAGFLGLWAAAGCCGSHCGYGCYPLGNACAPQCCSYPASPAGDTAYYSGSAGTPTVAAAPSGGSSNSGIRLKSSQSATTRR